MNKIKMTVKKQSLIDWTISVNGKVVFWIKKERGLGYRLNSTKFFLWMFSDFCIDFKDAKNTAKQYLSLID